MNFSWSWSLSGVYGHNKTWKGQHHSKFNNNTFIKPLGLGSWGSSNNQVNTSSGNEFNHWEPSSTDLSSCDRDTPAPGDCLRYYKCEAGLPVPASCPAHHSFDPVRRACVWIHLSTCGKESTPAPEGPPLSDNVPPNLGQVRAEEERITSQGEISLLKKRLATLDSNSVELVRPGRAANPANTKLVESILNEKDWEFLFPQRHESYTYTNFLQAVSKFPGVCHPDSEARCRLVLATMFAHFTQETGAHNPSGGVPQWRQGLHYIEELGCDSRDCGYSENCAEARAGLRKAATTTSSDNAGATCNKYSNYMVRYYILGLL